MKIKYNEYQNIEINSLLNSLQNKKTILLNYKRILNDLRELFDERFHKNGLYYFIHLFTEPVIFYRDIHSIQEYVPIYGFSFLEYIFLDKSQHDAIQKKMDEMYQQKYTLIKNPYFISFHTNEYSFIFEYIDTLLEEKREVKSYQGGDKSENEIKVKLKQKFNQNTYFETYLYTDFLHDFSHGSRTFISKETMTHLKEYIQKLGVQTYHEVGFFKKIRDELLFPNMLQNQYIVCHHKDMVGYEFYQLLKKIVSIQKFFIINEASAISFFYMPPDVFKKIMDELKLHIVESVGVYMDPYSKGTKINTIYKRTKYYNQVCNQIFQDRFFHDIYIQFVGITKYAFEMNSDFSTALLGRRTNSVQSLSIFVEYISTTHSIETVIKNHLFDLYQDQNMIEKEYKKIYKKYMGEHYHLFFTFLSSMTSLFLHHLHYFNQKYGKSIKRIICIYFQKFKFIQDHDTILKELKNGYIRENIIQYMNKEAGFIETYDFFHNQEYQDTMRLYFNTHFDKNPLFFKIILFFTRFKLCGDLLQLMEVDHDFVKYRDHKFVNKNGFLITHDRNLGTYAATHKSTNYICKSSLKNDEIYLFYRIENFLQ